MAETVWARREHWVGTQVEDSFVMVDIDGGQYVSLNETAAAIWNAVETPRSSAGIVEALQERFDVAPDACASAVARVLGELEAMRLIEAR